MPDYKLKIELDVSQFEKQFKDVLRRVNINSDFYGKATGGGARSPLGGGADLEKKMQDYQKRSLKTVEIIHKADMDALKLKYAQNKELAEIRDRMVKENTLLRQYGGPFSSILGAIGGRPGAAVGRLMDLKFKGSQGGEGSKIPQFVKIAGFAAGLAGAAGLGKLIIDSSPVLQAMLKILNVGIMFMLRPIGDFIGFLLRPFVILMLRYAVDFYKKFGGSKAKVIADEILEGDIPGTVNAIDELTTPKDNGFWLYATEFLKELTGFNTLNNLTDLIDFIHNLGTTLSILPTVHACPDFPSNGPLGYSPGGAPYQGPPNINPNDAILGSLDSIFGGGQSHEVNFEEVFRLNDLELETKKGVNFAEETKDFMQGIRDVFQFMEQEDSAKMQAAMQQVGIEFIEIKKNGRLAGSAMESVQKVFRATLKKVQDALRSFIRMDDDHPGEKEAKTSLGDLSKSSVVKTEERHGWRFLNPDGTVSHEITERGVVTKRMLDDWKRTGGRVVGFASGGFINEPVFGVGQNTGQGYMIGERGPEKVTPLASQSGGGSNITANFYVSGHDVRDVEEKLKPEIMRWLKEEASRRGIL